MKEALFGIGFVVVVAIVFWLCVVIPTLASMGLQRKVQAAMLKVIEHKRIENLSDDLILVTDSQDVEAIKDYLGSLPFDYDIFFVSVEDGDYSEVWGVEGNIPYLCRIADRLI